MAKSKKADKLFKYFYCIKEEIHPSLLPDAPSIRVETIVGDVHISFQGRLMCKESMEVIKNRLKAKKVKLVDALPRNIEVCKECTHEYKTNPSSPWYKWIDNSAPF